MRLDFLVPQRALSQWDFIPTSETIIILHTAFLCGACFDFWPLCQIQAVRPASPARCFRNEQHLPPSSTHVLAHFRTDRQAGTRNRVRSAVQCPKQRSKTKPSWRRRIASIATSLAWPPHSAARHLMASPLSVSAQKTEERGKNSPSLQRTTRMVWMELFICRGTSYQRSGEHIRAHSSMLVQCT